MRSREVLSRKAHDTVLPGLSIDKAGNSRAAEHSLCDCRVSGLPRQSQREPIRRCEHVGRRQRTERKWPCGSYVTTGSGFPTPRKVEEMRSRAVLSPQAHDTLVCMAKRPRRHGCGEAHNP